MNGKIGFMICVCALILFSAPATAEFEVPEDAVTFEYLGLSGNYDADAVKCQTKEATLQFTEPNEVEIVLSTYRDGWVSFYVGIYVNGLLATGEHVGRGNKEVTMIIPAAFIKTGENTIHLEFISDHTSNKFNKYPITIAPKSYAVSRGAPEIASPTKTPVYSPTPGSTIPMPTVTQTEVMGFSIQDIQKSSETAPEINIEPIGGQNLPNTTVLLSGSASSDSGIESVTVNGKDVGTESWSVPLDLSFGDNNIVIVATGKDGNTTVENISLSTFTSSDYEKESWISKNIIPLLALLLGVVGVAATLIKMNRSKSRASDGGDHKEVKKNGRRDSHK